jgi:hypothetical protein
MPPRWAGEARELAVEAAQEGVGPADGPAVHVVDQVGGDHGEAGEPAAGQVGAELGERDDPPAAGGAGADPVQVQERVHVLGVVAHPGGGGAGGGLGPEGHERSPEARRTRRSSRLHLKQLAQHQRADQIVVPKGGGSSPLGNLIPNSQVRRFLLPICR